MDFMDYCNISFYFVFVIYSVFLVISNILFFLKNLRINTILETKIVDNIQQININNEK